DPNESTAVEGEHFRLVDEGRVVMAANESTAFVTIEILDFPAESGIDTLVLALVGDDNVKVSHNYRQLGIAILLPRPPSETHGLYDELGPANYYNRIYVVPPSLDTPADAAQRIDQSHQHLMSVGDRSRVLQNFYFYFN